ncbi:SPOR domain-containing protein [Candidatus Haliotispira prima]|uniref:SPOR domain-containing protein n=1 Tax=Candidatus Haliotispira prima TaxID=3034016 RepID=A0ABY8MH15_9SPIO|nr:SPOR domain-containing protein [Candidatus Haliotispira prima]
MKVSEDRLPHPPQSSAVRPFSGTAQNPNGTNGEGSLPLQARRRVKPILADRPDANHYPNPNYYPNHREGTDHDDHGMPRYLPETHTSEQSPGISQPGTSQQGAYEHGAPQSESGYADYAGHQGQGGYDKQVSPQVASANSAHVQPGRMNEPYHSHYKSAGSPQQNRSGLDAPARAGGASGQEWSRQGPYQTVVVFLLLLMALVIMGIVYQLFFRPNSADSLADATEYDQAMADSGDSGKTVTEGESKEAEKTVGEGSENSGVSRQGHGANPAGSLSRSSPVSSVTPRGEVIARPAWVPPVSEDLGSTVDQDALLLQSKVGGIGYWIQVGAFSSLDNANNIRQQLTKNHLESVVQTGNGGGGKVYRVRVGLYTSKEEAERILRQLKNIGVSFAGSIIIKIEI